MKQGYVGLCVSLATTLDSYGRHRNVRRCMSRTDGRSMTLCRHSAHEPKGRGPQSSCLSLQQQMQVFVWSCFWGCSLSQHGLMIWQMALRVNRCGHLLFTCGCVRAAGQMPFLVCFRLLFLFCDLYSLCACWTSVLLTACHGALFGTGWSTFVPLGKILTVYFWGGIIWDLLSVHWSPSAHFNLSIYRLKMLSGVGSIDQKCCFCVKWQPSWCVKSRQMDCLGSILQLVNWNVS